MQHIVNPYGRVVALNDPKEAEYWLNQPGFRKATPQEEKVFIEARKELIESMTNPQEEEGKGVYLATVSPGGKDGYGIASAQLLQELKALKVSISTRQVGQKIALLFHNPYSILRLENPYRIIFTMFESDKIPDDWKDYLEAADRLLVPSRWVADTFARAGFKAEVVPLGYNHRVFTYKPRENKREQRRDFVFLHYNAFNIRKGFLEVFKAFCKAFDKTEPVKMIFKTTLDQIPLALPPSEYPNIEIIRGKVTDQELADLCYKSDCFVFPSRGEGFAMTPLEAMATGMPAIVPNAHGITEYFNEKFMYEVKVAEQCPAIYSKYKGIDVGKMVICDIDHLAAQMRYVYEHQDEAIEMGKKASEYVKNWTFEKAAKRLKEIFDEVDKLDLNERPIKHILPLEAVK